MSLEFRCRSCRVVLGVPEGVTSRRLRCPKCGSVSDASEHVIDEVEVVWSGVDEASRRPLQRQGSRDPFWSAAMCFVAALACSLLPPIGPLAAIAGIPIGYASLHGLGEDTETAMARSIARDAIAVGWWTLGLWTVLIAGFFGAFRSIL